MAEMSIDESKGRLISDGPHALSVHDTCAASIWRRASPRGARSLLLDESSSLTDYSLHGGRRSRSASPSRPAVSPGSRRA